MHSTHFTLQDLFISLEPLDKGIYTKQEIHNTDYLTARDLKLVLIFLNNTDYLTANKQYMQITTQLKQENMYKRVRIIDKFNITFTTVYFIGLNTEYKQLMETLLNAVYNDIQAYSKEIIHKGYKYYKIINSVALRSTMSILLKVNLCNRHRIRINGKQITVYDCKQLEDFIEKFQKNKKRLDKLNK